LNVPIKNEHELNHQMLIKSKIKKKTVMLLFGQRSYHWANKLKPTLKQKNMAATRA